MSSVDDQLTLALQRRREAQDTLIKALIAVDTLSDRIDVLLERRKALMPSRPFPR